MKKENTRIFFVCYIAYLFIYVARLNLSMAASGLRDMQILTMEQIGLLGSAFSVIYACGRLFSGILSDRIAPWKMISAGLLLCGFSNIFFGLFPPFAAILLLWGMNALSQSMLQTIGIIGGADGPTAVFVTGRENLDIDSIKSLLDGVDPTALLPDLSGLFGSLETVCRWAVMIGPVLLLAAGLAYLFLSPKEANYYFGYRTYFGMGSVHAWRFTQRLAGAILGGLGLILTVIMLIVSSGFGKLEVMDMVWRAVSCLTWEAALALLANVTVAAAAAATFDRNGEFRKKKKK